MTQPESLFFLHDHHCQCLCTPCANCTAKSLTSNIFCSSQMLFLLSTWPVVWTDVDKSHAKQYSWFLVGLRILGQADKLHYCAVQVWRLKSEFIISVVKLSLLVYTNHIMFLKGILKSLALQIPLGSFRV